MARCRRLPSRRPEEEDAASVNITVRWSDPLQKVQGWPNDMHYQRQESHYLGKDSQRVGGVPLAAFMVKSLTVDVVCKLYSMVRNSQPWKLDEPQLNEHGQPVAQHIAKLLGCVPPNSEIDLPVQSVFPENESSMAKLYRELEEHERSEAASTPSLARDKELACDETAISESQASDIELPYYEVDCGIHGTVNLPLQTGSDNPILPSTTRAMSSKAILAYTQADWSVVAIPQLDKHQEILLQMVSSFGSSGIITINNDTKDVVTCTIEPNDAEWFGLGISSAGLILAALGLPTVASPLVGLWVAWSGLLLAIGSLADTVSTNDDAKSMVLYPGDKMENVRSGWFTYWGIIMIPHAYFNSYQVGNIPRTPNINKRTLFDINLGNRSQLSQLRLLGIRGVQPDANLDVYGDPGTPNAGDILSYGANGAIVGSWTSAFDKAGDYFLRARSASRDTQIAIVQDARDGFGDSKNVSICHLLLDPYSPVLRIQDAEIQSEFYSPADRRAIGTARTDDDVMNLIQSNLTIYNWAYCHDNSSLPFTVYAWRWSSTNAVKKNRGRNTYFVVGAEFWTQMTMLK
ncbi:Fluconazole resistance 1 [Fusarium mexicanum]|uniref:Fluconazole resistance 1 n=1 Tax=Fusarium mexicanum TaxID=751941 RepID=A0A8H5I795_9HYPO|nr:Fluconazole resistance 1 [Fusarium mexicanum]